MQRRLADLDRARKQFIANASHELRTPIFSLGGFVELLEDEDPDPEARAEFVRTMREQVERLTKLTTDLLDLSKLDAGALEMMPRNVELDALARELAPGVRPTGRPPRLPARGPNPRRPGDRARRPRPGAADHPYPARQRPYPYARGRPR